LKRNKSPKTNPTSPDKDSHNQLSILASTGKTKPLHIRLNTLRKANPIISLIILTAMDPIL
jgi:hypothetical protein